MASPSRVVLGLGGRVDYELKLTAGALSRLAADYGIRAAELRSPAAARDGGADEPAADRDSAAGKPATGRDGSAGELAGARDSGAGERAVDGERDLVVSILRYVARGGGGEHFVASAPALTAFADRFPHRQTLGGTSVRAGILMSRLGIPSTLHLVSVNDTVRRLLPPDISYISSGTADTFYPHLIVQYDRGLRIRAGDLDITAPFPNRLIYVNDPANADLRLTTDLGDRLREATVFLISGFNAMRDRAELDKRLATLRAHMRQLPPGAITYFEDAAYHQPSFSTRVRTALLDAIDVYGLNEDELQSYLGRPVDLLSAPEVASALTELHTVIPVPTLVLHTKYWAAAFGTGAAAFAEPLDTGTLMAATRYAHGDTFTDENVDDLRHQPRRPESTAFAAALRSHLGDTVHCVPAFALDVENPTTVGLGDTFVGGFLTALARADAVAGKE